MLKYEKHLGILIGRNVNKLNILNSITEFTCPSNYMCSVFESFQFDTKYQLFKNFYIHLYDSVLWYFSNTDLRLFY